MGTREAGAQSSALSEGFDARVQPLPWQVAKGSAGVSVDRMAWGGRDHEARLVPTPAAAGDAPIRIQLPHPAWGHPWAPSLRSPPACSCRPCWQCCGWPAVQAVMQMQSRQPCPAVPCCAAHQAQGHRLHHLFTRSLQAVHEAAVWSVGSHILWDAPTVIHQLLLFCRIGTIALACLLSVGHQVSVTGCACAPLANQVCCRAAETRLLRAPCYCH